MPHGYAFCRRWSASESVPQLTAFGVNDAPVIANPKQYLGPAGIDYPTVVGNAKHQPT